MSQVLRGLDLAAAECEPGTEAIHGELVEAGEVSTTEAPLSNDQACIDSCTEFTGGYECWQKDAASNNCLASARWQCGEDRAWGTLDCTDFGDDDSLCIK